MAAKTTKDFTRAGSGEEYSYISDTEVLLTAPHKDGTLFQYFNFAAKDPSVRIVLDTGQVKMDIGTVFMEDIKDARVHHLSQAYLALRELGGDPFGTRAQADRQSGKKPTAPANPAK